MIYIKIFIFLTMLLAQNNYPIVLIHGFMGWGPNEMGGYSYWGGDSSLIKELERNGSKVIEVSVGPISSNWDRAVESYYQIKGGQVDYGLSHSQKNRIIQKPKNKKYDGFYPQWDNEHPIHIISHSMGGQTARMLAYLLSQEFLISEERYEQSQLLGETNLGWIKSITSIATPHDGTTLTYIITNTIPFVQYFAGIAGILGNNYFNFDLQHFGFNREKNESWISYVTRISQSSIINTNNFSTYDLSLDGAMELNGYLQASPEIYYFSFVTSTTFRDEKTGLQLPIDDTPLLNKARAKLIATRSGYWLDGEQTDTLWYENDGVVNTVSMYGPTTGANGSDPIIEYDSNDLLITGQWYWRKIEDMDHWSVLGHFGSNTKKWRARKIVLDHVKLLKSL
ncbi:MAG: lipase [Candidatus Marinimicrobia bacterium]|nr:lipase [Candidatus Neomarinimicrobiota bacterium]